MIIKNRKIESDLDDFWTEARLCSDEILFFTDEIPYHVQKAITYAMERQEILTEEPHVACILKKSCLFSKDKELQFLRSMAKQVEEIYVGDLVIIAGTR